MKNRILFLNGSGVGGAEMMTIFYACLLQKNGFECKIITQVSPWEKLHDMDNLPKNILHKEVFCRFRSYPFHVFSEIWLFHPDIIFAWNSIVVNKIINPLRKLHITPKFQLICRCPNTPSIMDPIECTDLVAFKQADIVIAQTKEMEKELHTIVGIDIDKIITINNPINKDRIAENIKEDFNFDKSYINYVAIGRISEQKDYLTLLKAFFIVFKKKSNIRLYICGPYNDDSLMRYLTLFVKNNHLESNVFFEGFQTNPHKYLKNADAYVLSSTYEGLPNALLDAIYLGIPVVATTSIPYISQIVNNGINGYTCPIKNPEILADAMLKAILLNNLTKFIDINDSEDKIVDLFQSITNIK